MPLTPTTTRAHGFTMIEVLIALVILSIGLLGLAGLQTAALQNNHLAYLRTQATIQAYDIVDRMRANEAGVSQGGYVSITGIPPDPGCILTGCTPLQMATYDAYAWNTMNADLLPSGTGTVTQTPNGPYQVVVQWVDRGPQSVTITTEP